MKPSLKLLLRLKMFLKNLQQLIFCLFWASVWSYCLKLSVKNLLIGQLTVKKRIKFVQFDLECKTMLTIKIFCTLSFLIHIFFIGMEKIFPKETFLRFEERKLKDIDFPVNFKICVNPGFNHSELKYFFITKWYCTDFDFFSEVGYKNIWHYFIGRSFYNASVYGWGGHFDNYSTVSSPAGRII